jgi:hypothetical protein
MDICPTPLIFSKRVRTLLYNININNININNNNDKDKDNDDRNV